MIPRNPSYPSGCLPRERYRHQGLRPAIATAIQPDNDLPWIQNSQFLLAANRRERPLHLEALGHFRKISFQLSQTRCQFRKIEFDAHEKHAASRVHGVLVRLNNVCTMLVQEMRYGSYNSWTIRTGNKHPRPIGAVLESGRACFA